MLFETVFRNSDPDQVFAELLPLLGEALKCDRCFLYLRNPQTEMGKATHCWRRNSQIQRF
jgi:GAF domain-containing protein